MTADIGALSTVLASFAASLVEGVEALTVVLAVGAVRGWRWAVTGSAAAVMVLLILVALFSASLARIPVPVVQLVIGTLLLLFGLRWLRKAILRSAAVIALHDEAASYAKHTGALRAAGPSASAWDPLAFTTAFNIVMLEGVEVVFIVIAMGASGHLIVPVALGAAAALLVVVCLGVALHRPLSNIPENTLKFGVGVVLSTFGSFWVGEGVHLQWPGDDASLALLGLFYLCLAGVLVSGARTRVRRADRQVKARTSVPPRRRRNALQGLLREMVSLFVDDGALAAGILGWAALAWWGSQRMPGSPLLHCGLFVAGFALVLSYSVLHTVRIEGSSGE